MDASTAVILPPLQLDDWEPTRNTLQLWLQIMGKVQLATTTPRNHWWHATFLVGVRGIDSHRLHREGIDFTLGLDLIDHDLVVRTDRGDERRLPLRDGLSVAEFDAGLHRILTRLGVDVGIREQPFGTPVSDVPFPDDREHASYDPEAAQRWWRALVWVADAFEEFAGWSCAKTSPVQLFWHSFDLAVTRFSGRRAPVAEGADAVTREAYSHEVISFGFWPGDPATRFAAFYSYAAPEPEGLRATPLRPSAASWTEPPQGGSLAVLPYEAVRTAADPRAVLLSFLQSAYEGAADLAGWDRGDLASSFCPSPQALAADVFGRAG